MSGKQLLEALAAGLGDAPADHRTGTYTLLHSVVWGQNIQGTMEIAARDTWRTQDGTVHYAEQRSKDNMPVAGFDPVKTIQAIQTQPPLIMDFTGENRTPDLALSGTGDAVKELTWYVQSSRQWQPAIARVRIDELVGIYMSQYVPKQMRQAILRALAAQPDVEFSHERSADVQGRAAIAFTAKTDNETITLYFHPGTGDLLAKRTMIGDRLFGYTLLEPAVWTDRAGPQNPQPTPPSTIAPTWLPGVGALT
ncbi:hypothetical protein [Catellatospora methionotrophica]|uniref:hypothetical protein n=1 Tax=Catellatospora methionotrophica TaxID=121620 RepID=UPI0033F68AC7